GFEDAIRPRQAAPESRRLLFLPQVNLALLQMRASLVGKLVDTQSMPSKNREQSLLLIPHDFQRPLGIINIAARVYRLRRNVLFHKSREEHSASIPYEAADF